MAAEGKYDPAKTQISEEKLTNWLREKITGDLEEVPGIGPANKKILEGVGIFNTHQLIGQYLKLKNGSVVEHQDAMFAWLQENVSSYLRHSDPFLTFFQFCIPGSENQCEPQQHNPRACGEMRYLYGKRAHLFFLIVPFSLLS